MLVSPQPWIIPILCLSSELTISEICCCQCNKPQGSEFLAPPAERQRSFSNTDLSVVCPSVKIEGGGVYLRNASVTFLLFWGDINHISKARFG